MLKKEIIEAAIAGHESLKEAAGALGVNYNTLRSWKQRLGLGEVAKKSIEIGKSLNILKGDPRIIGVVPDLHVPALHWDGVEWMVELFRKYNVGKVICIGDLIDNHATSRWGTYSDSLSPDDEWEAAMRELNRLHQLIPEMVIITGNHCRRVSIRSSESDIPKKFIKTLGEVVNLGGWEFWDKTGIPYEYDGVYYIHGDGLGSPNNPALQAERMGGNTCSGHTHKLRLGFASSPIRSLWGMQVGCLIDSGHYGMRYGANMVSKIQLGCGIIDNGNPFLFEYRGG